MTKRTLNEIRIKDLNDNILPALFGEDHPVLKLGNFCPHYGGWEIKVEYKGKEHYLFSERVSTDQLHWIIRGFVEFGYIAMPRKEA